MENSTEDLDRYREDLRQGLLDIAIKLGEGVGRDGKPYQWMVDCRELLLTGPYLHYACRLLWERVKQYQPHAIGGLTLAANPLTIGLMYEARAEGREVEGLLIRREPKNNGLMKQVEGSIPQEDWRVVLLDDLVNGGGTQRQAMSALRPFGSEVVAVGVIVDYERVGTEWLLDQGIELEALFTLSELGLSRTEPTQPELFERVWAEDLNVGTYSAPKSTPVAKDAAIYVGSDRGYVQALSLQGESLWKYELRDKDRGTHSTPLVGQDRLVVGSYDGFLSCLELTTGKLLWEQRPGQWIGSSAVFGKNEDVLYVGIEYGESGGSLIAVRAEDGEKIWDLPARHYIHSTPFYDHEREQVLVGSNDGMLRCANAESGELQWDFQTGGEIKAQAVVDPDGHCFFCSFDGNLYALDATNGEPLWTKRLSDRLYFTPLLFEDLVIAGGTSQRLVALDRKTGKVRWLRTVAGAIMGGASLDIESRTVIIGDHRGGLTAISLDDGTTVWTHSLGNKFMGTPCFHEGKLLVASYQDLVCFQKS